MGDVFYKELKEASKEIAEVTGKAKEEGDKLLLDTMREIMGIARIVRREGLPVLESFTQKIEDKSVAAMLLYSIDGTSSEVLEDICWSKYYASQLGGYEGLVYMLWLRGVLSMQEGENPSVIGERLKAMLPEDVLEEYERIYSEWTSESMTPYGGRVDMETVRDLCGEDIVREPGTDGYILMKIARIIFVKEMDDAGIKRLVADTERDTMSIAMKGFDGDIRKAFFDNMSEQEAVITAGDIEYMGPVLKKHIIEAILSMFEAVKRLCKDGEIKADISVLEILD